MNNLIILENYQLVLEAALFAEYTKAANSSQKLKEKFRELDQKNASKGFKPLMSPNKDQEVEILKQISRSNTFKAAAAGIAAGAGAAGLKYAFQNRKTIQDKVSKLLSKKDKPATEAPATAPTTQAPASESMDFNYLVSESVALLLEAEGEEAKPKVSLTDRIKGVGTKIKNSKVGQSVSSNYDKVSKAVGDKVNKVKSSKAYTTVANSKVGKHIGAHKQAYGTGALALGAGALAFAKVIAKNTKQVSIAGRKVYAILSKDQKTIFSMALPYTNGVQVKVSFVKASAGSL